MAINSSLQEYLIRAFNPNLQTNSLASQEQQIELARKLGIPVEQIFNMESGSNEYRINPRSYDENQSLQQALKYGDTLENLYNQYVPQDLRDYFSGPGVGQQFFGQGDRVMGVDPLTGQQTGLWQFAGAPTMEGDPGSAPGAILPDRLAQAYQSQLRPSWVQKDIPDGLFQEKLFGALASLPAAYAAGGALSNYFGGAGTSISAAEAAAAAEAADAAAVIGGSGAGGGLGAAAGGAVAGFSMPPAIPTPDPTFGNALIQTAPGVYAAPGAAGYVGASGLGGAVYGADIPSLSVPGAGTNAPGPQMPKPPVPPGSTTLLGQLKDLAKDVSPYAPLLGMAAGGLAGAAGGGSQAGTITVEEGIPDWLMPYVKPTLDKYSTEVQNYQTDPYGVMPAAMQEFKNTVSGMYLDPSTNKWLEEYYKLGAERIKGTLSPSFGHMQAFGSHSGYNEALSRGLGDFATGLYGGNYAKERDRQTQMTAAAPNFLTQSSTSAFAPYSQYLNAIGNLGKKKDQPYWEPSALQNILGGGMAGYGLGSMIGKIG